MLREQIFPLCQRIAPSTGGSDYKKGGVYRREYIRTLPGNLSSYMEEAAAPVLLVVNKYTAAFNNAAPGSEHLWELATTGKNVNNAGQPSQTQVYPLHCVMPAPSLLQISFFEKG